MGLRVELKKKQTPRKVLIKVKSTIKGNRSPETVKMMCCIAVSSFVQPPYNVTESQIFGKMC